MVELTNPVGRLLLVRFADPLTEQEMRGLGRSLPTALKKLQPKRGVICADFSGLKILSPEVGDAWIELAKSDNPMMECSGLLLPTTQVMKLQMLRLVREAGSPSRRTFQDPWELSAWLSPRLGADEIRQMNDFLAQAEFHSAQLRDASPAPAGSPSSSPPPPDPGSRRPRK